MQNISRDKFNKLLKQYKALSVERLEIENEILRSYESLNFENAETAKSISTSEKFKTITSLKERLKTVNQVLKKTDRKIMKFFKEK
jgi:ppGpp synthetase/RelA/SpoT-type nucleotidyltranferase